MKKFFLTLVVAMMSTTSMFAQSSVLATLSHDGEISTFYGATALSNALFCAQHGDVITLSSGSFKAGNITKAVTIRGAGMQVDSIAKIYPSVIVGNFSIDIPDSLEQHLTVEGIYCDNNSVIFNQTLRNATFIKSRFYRVSGQTSNLKPGYMKNVAFIHCKIQNGFYFNYTRGNSISFVNSLIKDLVLGSSTYSDNSFEFTNCIVKWDDYNPSSGSYYAIYRNCILSSSDTGEAANYLSSTNLIYNSLGIAPTNMFTSIEALGSSMFYTAKNLSDVFKTWTGEVSEIQTYELTDEAKTKYLGDDGKELGIYGGNLPFTPNPTNPKITKFNVASKSTADGKLSVDIEVKAAE